MDFDDDLHDVAQTIQIPTFQFILAFPWHPKTFKYAILQREIKHFRMSGPNMHQISFHDIFAKNPQILVEHIAKIYILKIELRQIRNSANSGKISSLSF